ncbi:MAG: SDR family NAD(P)-dependent oxidoreductase [Propionibacteriaceae bacterium]|nr:SDR family NAD(P)-dependent oxidoreductase [Propionibacteriaceae bacterium]
MEQRTVIITGANSGLGRECAKYIASADPNYTVVLACRNPTKAAEASASLRQETGNENIFPMIVDLSSLDSVRQLRNAFDAADLPPLYSLVCNAGFNRSGAFDYTKDGYESIFGVCYLGHFLLANLMLSRMADHGRLVFVSSDMHRIGRPHAPAEFTDAYVLANREGSKRTMVVYNIAKLCIILNGYEMAQRMKSETGTDITVNLLNPGLMADTNIWPGPRNGVGGALMRTGLNLMGTVLRERSSAAVSGRTLANMVTSGDYEGITGQYISFQGDPQPSSPASYDQAAARKLWLQSVDLVHMTQEDTPLKLDPDEAPPTPNHATP